MKTIITKDENYLIIKVPLKSHRSNPYMDEDYHPEMDNIVGVIAGDETGFANWIDMDYKGKEDQISVPFYTDYMEKGEFRNLCKELGIEVHEYLTCAHCNKAIYGSCRYTDKGHQCYDCELAEEAIEDIEKEQTTS